MNECSFDLVASLFSGIRPGELIASLATLVTICDAHEIPIRPRIRPTLIMLQQMVDEERGTPRADIARGREIEELYAELRQLEADPANEARYQARLSRLRVLQEAEAREMEAFFEARRLLPRGAVDAALNQADALLHDHESPAASNRTRQHRG